MHDVLQYTVTFENGETKQYPEGTTFLEIAKDRQKEYKNDVVLVIQDGKLKELYKTLRKDCRVRLVTTGEDIGYKTYKRSMSLMLVKAVYDTAGHDKIQKCGFITRWTRGITVRLTGISVWMRYF